MVFRKNVVTISRLFIFQFLVHKDRMHIVVQVSEVTSLQQTFKLRCEQLLKLGTFNLGLTNYRVGVRVNEVASLYGQINA